MNITQLVNTLYKFTESRRKEQGKNYYREVHNKQLNDLREELLSTPLEEYTQKGIPLI